MEKLNELLSNPEFLKKVESTSSVEKAIELFCEQGVAVTEAELRTILVTPVEEESGELSEESLESATGGASLLRYLIRPVWSKIGGGSGAFGGGGGGSR